MKSAFVCAVGGREKVITIFACDRIGCPGKWVAAGPIYLLPRRLICSSRVVCAYRSGNELIPSATLRHILLLYLVSFFLDLVTCLLSSFFCLFIHLFMLFVSLFTGTNSNTCRRNARNKPGNMLTTLIID